jgi:hypothetical protein
MPNRTDRFEPQQWNLKPGRGGINAEAAWDLLGAGDVATVVAMIDSGLLFGHEDIIGRVVTVLVGGASRRECSAHRCA